MNIPNARTVSPNVIMIHSPIKNYSPIDVVNFYMDQLDKSIKTYFLLNLEMQIMHKVVIHPNHIESTDIILY